MLASPWVAIPVAAVLGLLSGLGTGGGSLLILWLTLVLDMEPDQARIINLMFFLPSALIAVIFHQRQGLLNIQALLPAIAAGCFGAYLISFLSANMDLTVLKKLFGALLIITGVRELMYKEKAGQ